MENLKIENQPNTNSNKNIGIFAKKGPIYCSQYYCRPNSASLWRNDQNTLCNVGLKPEDWRQRHYGRFEKEGEPSYAVMLSDKAKTLLTIKTKSKQVKKVAISFFPFFPSYFGSKIHGFRFNSWSLQRRYICSICINSVSYTHLTLPTICSV